MAGGRDESNIFFNKKDGDDGVIVREWMGPDAPTLANLLTSANLFINTRQFTNHLLHRFAISFNKSSVLISFNTSSSNL